MPRIGFSAPGLAAVLAAGLSVALAPAAFATGLTITTKTLPAGGVGLPYSQKVAATGGTGQVTWKLASGSSLVAGLSLSSAGVVSGTPSVFTPSAASFSVTATDSATHTATASISYTIEPRLTIVTPHSLPPGTVGVPYNSLITASGGGETYTWTINGAKVPTTGTAVDISNGDGLKASSTGGTTLSLTGSPTGAATVTIGVTVTDTVGAEASGSGFTIVVANPNSATVTGKIDNLNNWCGNGMVPGYPPIKVTLSTSPVKTTTADSNGNYTFTGVPQGTFTVTPSITIAGSSSVFYPATQKVTLSGGHGNTVPGFTFSVGYTVSGTVAYAGSATGRIYISLNSNCGGTTPGITIPAKGAYSIRGVPPGDYTLEAGMDTLGSGQPNVADPFGTAAIKVSTTANRTGADVTMLDPGAVTLAAPPQINGVSPFSQGVLAEVNPIQNNNGVEMATSYTFEWSTTQAFTTVAGTRNFPAVGTDSTDIWVLGGLTNGQALYFRARGVAGSSKSPWSTVFGPVTVGAPAGDMITGTVTFDGTATGPLYTGFYNNSNGKVYLTEIQHPVSPQAYTVHVPAGDGYFHFGVIDQNNDGVVDVGDIQNTGGKSKPVNISGPVTNDELALPTASSVVDFTASQYHQVNQFGTTHGFNINFSVRPAIKAPIGVTLLSGPNVLTPQDVVQCQGCGKGVDFNESLFSDTPKVGDSYSFETTYTDGTTSTQTDVVSAVPNSFATNLAPVGNGSNVTPTFTWTDPVGASSYLYSFTIWDQNGNQIWSIPQNTNGFSSSITSIHWGTDPTDSTNKPSVPSLTSGETYQWQIEVIDAQGNSTFQQVAYTP